MNVKDVRLVGDCIPVVFTPREPVWITPPDEDRRRSC